MSSIESEGSTASSESLGLMVGWDGMGLNGMDGLELTWRLKQRYEKKNRLKKKGRFGDQNLDLLCSQCSPSSSFFCFGGGGVNHPISTIPTASMSNGIFYLHLP